MDRRKVQLIASVVGALAMTVGAFVVRGPVRILDVVFMGVSWIFWCRQACFWEKQTNFWMDQTKQLQGRR